MDNPNAPKPEEANPTPEAEGSNPAPAPDIDKENTAPEETGSNPAPEVEKPSPAPEAEGSNPAPEVDKPNPAPQVEGSNPAPPAKAPLVSKVKAPNRKKKGADGTGEEFNLIEQGDVAELVEIAPQLKKAIIGAGWDLIGFDESAADLDISLFMLNKDDETREDGDFIFYGNEEALDGGIKHTGDSRTGAGSGDDEQITVDFSTIPFDVVTIAVVLTIYDPENKEFSFQNVRNVYMRLEDSEEEQELFRYLMDEELKQVPENSGTANCLHIGNFERDANNWKFNALGKIDDGGLAKIATKYGLIIVMG